MTNPNEDWHPKCFPGSSHHNYKLCKYHLEHIDKAIEVLDDADCRFLLKHFESEDGAIYLHSNMTWLCVSDCKDHADKKDPSNYCSGISASFIYPGWKHWKESELNLP